MGYRGIQYLRPGADLQPSPGELEPGRLGRFPRSAARHRAADRDRHRDRRAAGDLLALWIVEYGTVGACAEPNAVVESSIEIVAGTPDILIAVFGLAIFQLHFLRFASSATEGGGVTGTSFLAAGAMMSLIALPPLFVATRDGLQAVPAHMREAAFALGKTRIATIRRVLLPSVRPNIATGVTLGVSRIIADTAIVIVLLGDELRISPHQAGFPA